MNSLNQVFKLRNGKYMNQISKNDKRYNLLNRIPKILFNCNDVYKVIINKHVSDFVLYETYSGLYVDLENDKIIYTFCYNIEDSPEIFHLWERV
jgi:hypothetical protein